MKIKIREKIDPKGVPRTVLYWTSPEGRQCQFYWGDLPTKPLARILKISREKSRSRQLYLISKTPWAKWAGNSQKSLAAALLLRLKKVKAQEQAEKKRRLKVLVAKASQKRTRRLMQIHMHARRLPPDPLHLLEKQLDTNKLEAILSDLRVDQNRCPGGHFRPDLRDRLRHQLLRTFKLLDQLRSDLEP